MSGDPQAHVGGSDGWPWNSQGVSSVMDWGVTQAHVGGNISLSCHFCKITHLSNMPHFSNIPHFSNFSHFI